MKGRRAGGKSEKRRDRKTAKPKQSSGSHSHVRRTSSGIRKVADVQQLIQERDAALDQQAATSEILEVISRSTGDLQRSLQPYCRTRFASATQALETFTVGSVVPFICSRVTTAHQHLLKNAGAQSVSLPVQTVRLLAYWRPNRRFTLPI